MTLFSRFLFFLIFVLAGIMAAGTARGQNVQAETSSPDSTELVVRRLNFKGNDHVSSSTLEMLIRTHTNREFLGISGFTPWYYIWQLTDQSFGEEAAYLNYETLTTDLERITRYYNSIGFLEATADTNVAVYDDHKARVTFIIEEGPRSYLQSIAYTGLPDSAFQSHRQKVEFYRSSSLTGNQINDSTYTSDMPYLENQLDQERSRIIDHLKNNGYAAVQRDSITALVKRDAQDKHMLDVLYVVNPGERYTFGDLTIRLAGPTDTLYRYQDRDTLQAPPHTVGNTKIYLMKEESAQTRFSLLTDQVLFKPGNIFSNQRYVRTINEFQNLGMLTIRQFGLSEDSTPPDYSKDQIPVHFFLQTLPKHSINLNVFGLKRYGYGSGAGITYSNNNLFGKAENLQLSLNGSFEYIGEQRLGNLPDAFTDTATIRTDNKFFQNFEARVDLSLPRLTFPFTGLDEQLFFANSRTRYSLSFRQSDQLLFDINSDVTYTQQYQVQHNSRFTSILDLLQLEVLDTNPSEPFREALENEFEDNPLALQQILEDFRPQFTSILRYTFRSKRTDLIKRNFGYFSEYSLSVGGNIPYLIDRLFVTPGTIEGNIPSPVQVSDNSLDYSRYVKATADYRRYFPLSSNTVFAARGLVGYALPYGQSRTIPLNQRFYAGGSNDIRGWPLFGLGPGTIPFEDVTINGGEIKLLSQLELRQVAFRNLMSSNWILALFADAGNVWYGPVDKIPSDGVNGSGGGAGSNEFSLEDGTFELNEFYKEIAVGSGLGLRLDFEYLVARIDFAFRIHDLQKGWFENGTPYFHFGIGHSF